ncbi:MAG: hypothetical protein WBP15_12705, partial [Tabrizicola sp.]
MGPLSSEEIEDVVSSVRRLVSNEQSLRRTTRDLTADRLVLTPALRVVSEIAPLSTLILDAPVSDVARATEAAPEIAAPEIPPEPAPSATDEPAAEAPAVELIEADWEDLIWAAPEAMSLGEAALGAEEAEVLLPPGDEAAAE